ncbi:MULTISPECIES: glycoside hydrolase family 6 protein [Streptomyces]|uniref:glycoside hydrolase family 6 protein n=1 Tax=Streptomyces TaxID=1883 RepID=UPI00163C64FD|nr:MULTISPECIES: glycoside hydrolase family 6 protein [Streptomyces]MBC2877788.1 glycoside hydrolase family 6 protein [Streptomyces sp. TYQ1024]UBI38690.1 glycoside hydrolase family 6 protein [Streptomyces mobaraensis]UKW31271.1 glycoside hydrolase family 6 protein [Streptomyces sp. TYQ1024]
MYGSHTGHTRPACSAHTALTRTGSAMAALAALAGLAGLTGCSSSDDEATGPGPQPSAASPSQLPRDHSPFWVNPNGNAARQAARLLGSGKEQEARLIAKIAQQPVAEWIGVDDPESQTRGFTEAAAKADRDALLVLYNIPHRDCGQYSQGGAADGDSYRAWLDRAASGIGDRRATVILEPDALPHMEDGCTPQQFHEERYALLKEAVRRLKALPRTKVYLDAGNPSWVTPADRMAEPLRRAGIDRADGFALNVSNFQTTQASKEYGHTLSALVGYKHFVIDTSRNGNGPLSDGDHEKAWCNPSGRALGEPPTTRTGDRLVDAYLWVKRPGESDGACKGGPDAGEWWETYALELARNARS